MTEGDRSWMSVDWSDDVSAGTWIAQRLHAFGSDVGAVVPPVFDAYCRVLHPAWRVEDRQSSKVRWATLVRSADRTLRGTTQFEELVLPQGVEPPSVGRLEADELSALLEVLADSTDTVGDCWFGIWAGFGWIQGGDAIAELNPDRTADRVGVRTFSGLKATQAKLQIPGRDLLLYRGPVWAAAAFVEPPVLQTPNLWWPQDRAWCVASDIDLDSTYVGGAHELVDELLRDARLESLPVRVYDTISVH